jgi:hypothetical protein
LVGGRKKSQHYKRHPSRKEKATPQITKAQIELLDTSEEDGGGNEAASAKLKAGEESDTELSNAQDD